MLSANADNIGNIIQRMHDIEITKIPVNPLDLIMANRWQIGTYHTFEQTLGMTCQEICEQISSRAFTFYSHSHDTFYIFYNGEREPDQIRFSLCHEIGHIVYGHISKEMPVLCRKDQNKSERDKQADEFACFILQTYR